MTQLEKMLAVEKYVSSIKDTSFSSDHNIHLDLCSQINCEGVQYRADIGYMVCGYFEPTILGAFESLYDELVRVGEIKE